MFKSLPFFTDITSIEKSQLGLTNQNYLITTKDNQSYFVRIPYPHNYDIFDYQLEEKVHQLATDINLPFDSLDTKTGIKISPYVDGVKHLDECDLKVALPKVAKLLQQLHSKPRLQVDFDIQKHYQSFKENTTKALYDLTQYESLLDRLKDYPQRVLCHNDLVNGNVIEVNGHMYLIDYEYACDNHPYFDLLSLITENNIHDQELRLLFLESYFNHSISSQLWYDLRFFEAIHHLLWCQWAQMQQSKIPNPLYQAIAQDKYQQLIKLNL